MTDHQAQAQARIDVLFDDDAPVLIFGGPYSNVQATRAVRAEATRRGIAPDHVICTGDVVAYCADPVATVDELRDWGCAVLAGNCEKQLASGAADCGCGFAPGTTCDLLSAGWYAHASAALDADARGWMADVPDFVAFRHAGRQAVALHGGVSDISRFLWDVSDESDFSEELKSLEAVTSGVASRPQWVFAGHSGLPFQRMINDVLWVNAGVIGMPPHDGGQATRYAVVQDGQVSLHRLDYDWRAARRAMEQAGLTQGYHRALEAGIWPSEDVLPQALRRQS